MENKKTKKETTTTTTKKKFEKKRLEHALNHRPLRFLRSSLELDGQVLSRLSRL